MARVSREEVDWLARRVEEALANAHLGMHYFIELRLGGLLSEAELEESFLKLAEPASWYGERAAAEARERLSRDVSWRDVRELADELDYYFYCLVSDAYELVRGWLGGRGEVDLREVEGGLIDYAYREYYELLSRLYELYVKAAEGEGRAGGRYAEFQVPAPRLFKSWLRCECCFWIEDAPEELVREVEGSGDRGRVEEALERMGKYLLALVEPGGGERVLVEVGDRIHFEELLEFLRGFRLLYPEGRDGGGVR